jgi:hypothetical protein
MTCRRMSRFIFPQNSGGSLKRTHAVDLPGTHNNMRQLIGWVFP